MTSIQDLETVQKGLHILYSVLTISAINMVVLLLENGWNLNKHVCKNILVGFADTCLCGQNSREHSTGCVSKMNVASDFTTMINGVDLLLYSKRLTRNDVLLCNYKMSIHILRQSYIN